MFSILTPASVSDSCRAFWNTSIRDYSSPGHFSLLQWKQAYFSSSLMILQISSTVSAKYTFGKVMAKLSLKSLITLATSALVCLAGPFYMWWHYLDQLHLQSSYQLSSIFQNSRDLGALHICWAARQETCGGLMLICVFWLCMSLCAGTVKTTWS